VLIQLLNLGLTGKVPEDPLPFDTDSLHGENPADVIFLWQTHVSPRLRFGQADVYASKYSL